MSYLQVKESFVMKYFYTCIVTIADLHALLCRVLSKTHWYVTLICYCSIDADCWQFLVHPWTLCAANRNTLLQNQISIGCYLLKTPHIMVYHLSPSNYSRYKVHWIDFSLIDKSNLDGYCTIFMKLIPYPVWG